MTDEEKITYALSKYEKKSVKYFLTLDHADLIVLLARRLDLITDFANGSISRTEQAMSIIENLTNQRGSKQ